MKTIKDIMTSDVVWISPTAKAKQAIILLKGYDIDALPVVYSHDSVVGMVYCSSLIGQNEDAAIIDLMSKEFKSITSDTPVFQAAELMKAGGFSHLLVVDAGKMAGIVSRSDVVMELGKSYDTLTGLPWQDAFREWSIDALDRGLEISVILIDLNLFGRFNKKYGHVMGDRVLKSVAEALKSEVNVERDFLCRYAGDEFAVATYRRAAEASDLGATLVRRISEIEISDLPEQVGATFGLAGGRRLGGRETVHSGATLDDLITNASLNCTLSKPKREDAGMSEAGPSPQTADENAPQSVRSAGSGRLKIQTIRLSTTSAETTAEVMLSRGDDEYAHSVTGYAVGGKSMLRLVAEAAAASATKALSDGHGVVVDDVINLQPGDDQQIVTVIATYITPRNTTTHAGSAFVRRSDPYRASAAALLSAINRQIAIAPASESVDQQKAGQDAVQQEQNGEQKSNPADP